MPKLDEGLPLSRTQRTIQKEVEKATATAQATIASLTAEKDAAERRVVELEKCNLELAWSATNESDLAVKQSARADEAEAALSQERTAREEAERERDAIQHQEIHAAEIERQELMARYVAKLDEVNTLEAALDESRTARQAAEGWHAGPGSVICCCRDGFHGSARWVALVYDGHRETILAALTPTAPAQRATEEA